MKGLYIGKNGESLDKAVQKSAELNLLAKGDGVEVMHQKIKADKLFTLEPSSNAELMEFFYIINGKVNCSINNTNEILTDGDYFFLHHLRDSVVFKTLIDTTLLWVSSKPVFHYVSNTIKELTNIIKEVEDKDTYTHHHSVRVRDYSVKIANKLGIIGERLEDLVFASLFHDIGKVCIPNEVLNKSGPLTDNEMELIKAHPKNGMDMVKKTYYEDIGSIIEQHHERLDGSGYPYGLKGEDISLEAKIIAVADSYDAMTSDRIYRKAMKPIEALNELKDLSDKLYDKQIVETLELILQEEHTI